MREFETKLDGLLYSLLSWDQLAAFWTRVDLDARWYLYAVGQEVPATPASREQVAMFMQKIDALLRHEHDESYCGIVYADDLERPHFIKIYDPGNLGVSCGSSKVKVQPGWIMSQIAPVELQAHIVPANRARWWQGLFDNQ